MLHYLKKMVLLPMCFVMLLLTLQGCASNPELKTLIVSPEIPKQLLKCKDAPDVPTGSAFTQKDVSKYIVKLYESHEDCQGNLLSVKQLLQEFEKANSNQE